MQLGVLWKLEVFLEMDAWARGCSRALRRANTSSPNSSHCKLLTAVPGQSCPPSFVLCLRCDFNARPTGNCTHPLNGLTPALRCPHAAQDGHLGGCCLSLQVLPAELPVPPSAHAALPRMFCWPGSAPPPPSLLSLCLYSPFIPFMPSAVSAGSKQPRRTPAQAVAGTGLAPS